MTEIKQIPDERTLDKLIEIAERAEKKAEDLYLLATEINEKWQFKLDNKRKLALEQNKFTR